MKFFVPVCLVFVVAAVAFAADLRPIVLWHGMGDSCCNPRSLGGLQKYIEEQLPGVYVHSIEIGKSDKEDAENSFFMSIDNQLAIANAQIVADPKLANGFNAVGFSQGGQFLRAYVQRFNSPRVYNLVSVGGQHQGVFGFPNCVGESSELCEVARKMLQSGAYIEYIQNHLAQAEYWHDPLKEAEYLAKCVFMPDINNALPTKNTTYVKNLASVNSFTMVMFENDTMVQPRESEWFGFYAPGQDKTIIPLQQSDLYTQDWLGLKEMDNNGQLKFISTPGEHLQFTEAWFLANIITPLLNNTLSG